MTITLDEDDYDLLCFVLGIATGTAMRDKAPELAQKCHALYLRIQAGVEANPKTNEPGS